jgi:hypothetical protein
MVEEELAFSMPRIATNTRLEQVEHILGSGNGTLDFAVKDKREYLTWDGSEDADWEMTGVERIENDREDRFIVYPEGEFFVCEIDANDEEGNSGRVVCRGE